MSKRDLKTVHVSTRVPADGVNEGARDGAREGSSKDGLVEGAFDGVHGTVSVRALERVHATVSKMVHLMTW